jgi:alpha-mannosidase
MVRIISIEPSVLFVRRGQKLEQLVRLSLQSDTHLGQASLELLGEGIAERIALGDLPAGATEVDVYVPDIRQAMKVTWHLWVDGTLQDERIVPWRPERHWEIYLVHYSHHDLGYTDLPENVLREHVEILDQALDFCEQTADWPPEERFHYLVEQSWSVARFVESRPPAQVERLVRAIQSGQVEVTALFGNQTSELLGHEEIIRQLYPAFALKHRYGVEISSAEHNDIPGYCWALASTLAGAGVRYFSPGVPLWYFRSTEEWVHPLWEEARVLDMEMPGAFWWEGIDGSRVLLWSDLHGSEWLPAHYAQALRELPGMLHTLEERGYPYDLVSYTVRGGHRDNAPVSMNCAQIAREWNSRWAYPRLINANNQDFLPEFERRYGHTLRTLRGDVPGTDYAVAATCTPRETALNRDTHDQLLAAEKWATLVALLGAYDYPRAMLSEAYRDTLYYDEHCWGMAHPGGPAQDGCYSEKGGYAYRAAALAHDVLTKAANRIVDHIRYADEGYHVTVFNPLSWPRTELVRACPHAWASASMPMHWTPPGDSGPILTNGGAIGRSIVSPPLALLEQPFELLDVQTGRAAPYQISRMTDPQAAQPWAAERVAMGKIEPRHALDIVVAAEDLPATGYRTYRLAPCARWPEYAIAAQASVEGVENAFFRLQVDPASGAVLSLFDKALGHELIDHAAPHRFAQLLSRASEGGGAQGASLRVVGLAEHGPLYSTIRLRGSLAGCPALTQEITLYHTIKRIDVAIRLLRDSTPNMELYCAFPFQVSNPHFRYEATGTVIEPLRDQLPGTNTDYYAVQHWAEVSNDAGGLLWTALDAPMAEFGGLWPGYVSGAHHGVTPPGYGHPFLQPGELKVGHIYSLLMYSNFRTNFINVHAGEALFRYSLTTRGAERPAGWAHRSGWGAVNPPTVVWMEGPQAGSLAPAASLAHVDVPNVMLLTMKRAEDGQGLILRLVETEGYNCEAVIELPLLAIRGAYQTNLVEENGPALPCEPHSVRVAMRPYATTTVRVTL